MESSFFFLAMLQRCSDLQETFSQQILKKSLTVFWERNTQRYYINCASALRVPGGNQVDGLPPVLLILTRGEIAWAWDRAHLWHWTSDLKFNGYFAFWLLVLLHSCIEVLFCVSISLFARPNLYKQPVDANSKKLMFLVGLKKNP